jgi:NADPH:quinone reductase-like Zn-dependent oxidoreductase
MEKREWKLMRAGVAAPRWELQLGALPAEPGSGMLRISVHASGINFADALMMQGLYGDAPETPFVPGYEVVGRVVSLGDGAPKQLLGKDVMAFTPFGGFSSALDLPANQVVVAPANLRPEQVCALVTPYVTAWYLSEVLCTIQPGDRVLVHSAAGSVGRALVETALRKGAEVWFCSRSEAKLQTLAQDFPGQHGLLNSEKRPWWNQLPGNVRFDRIFDPLAGRHLAEGLKRLRAGGIILAYGAAVRAGRQSKLRDAIMLWQSGFYNPVGLLLKSKSIATLNMLHLGRERPDLLIKGLGIMAERAESGIVRPPLAQAIGVDEFEVSMQAFARGERQGKLALVW